MKMDEFYIIIYFYSYFPRGKHSDLFIVKSNLKKYSQIFLPINEWAC